MAGKGAKARATARKQRDKWKAKRWYTIRAPRQPWHFKVIGETLGETPEHLTGRIYEITQNEVDGDFSKMHVKLRFRVHETRGEDALTEFVGHSLQNDFVRRQVRRYRGKIDDVVDCVTDDGYYVRLKPMLVTSGRVKSSQKTEIRKIAKDIILQNAAKSTWLDLQNSILNGSLETLIADAVKVIQPARSVVFRKSQLLQSGVVVEDGPTLEEVYEDEKRAAAEREAKKAAALAAAEEDEDDDSGDEAEEATEEESPVEDEDNQEAAEEPATDDSEDLSSLTVAELKERLKAAGKPVSGKKAELIARLSE
tara:strand:- start:86 stop:1015 length:930 start_codon:yes stop_codon:yes gene_type:complete